ncbi:MAG: SPOR domain-containing protein [Myxococcaceae bacterium]
MRDSHRMKEKYDLSLDSRQLVTLLAAGIVVLGAVFTLGVLVGQKLAGAPRTDRAPDLLSALDQKSAALERARAAPTLTFQEELTADGGATPAGKAKPEPVGKMAESKPEVAKAVEKKPEAPASKSADAGAVATRGAASAAAKAPDATAVPGGAFTLQLGASQNREDAERMVSRLREKGYAPYIVSAEVPGKGTYYRVRMGSFATREAASRYLEDFRRETKTEAFVASTK